MSVPVQIVLLIVSFMILGLVLETLFIVKEDQKKYVPAVILKGSASLMFVLIGFVCRFFSSDPSFSGLVAIGLILGALGDVLLNLRYIFKKIDQKIFLFGILVFLSGHILYLCALIPKSTTLAYAVIIGIIIAAFTLWQIFTHIEPVKPAFRIFGVVYIGAIELMMCISIGNMITGFSVMTVLYAIGAIFFTASDIILIFNTFCKTKRQSLRIANLALYYAGQLLIAVSIMFS